jgi:hypothetical protein
MWTLTAMRVDPDSDNDGIQETTAMTSVDPDGDNEGIQGTTTKGMATTRKRTMTRGYVDPDDVEESGP